SYTDKSAPGALALTGNTTLSLRSPSLPASDAATLDGATKGEFEGRSFALIGGESSTLGFGKTDLTGVRSVRIHYATIGENQEGWTVRLQTANGDVLAEDTIGNGV